MSTLLKAIYSFDFLSASIRLTIPVLLAALGDLYCERAGVLNIGLEGMMLTGAFASFTAVVFTSDPYFGLLVAIGVGLLLGLVHAFLTVTLGCNQVVAALGENMFATGITATLNPIFFNVSSTLTKSAVLPNIALPGLSGLGTVGQILFNQNILYYLAVIMVPLTYVLLYHTTLGLKIRAIGEHPKTADTLGINVICIRYFTVIISGIFAALGGAAMTIGNLSFFQEGMTAGRGFIAFAAVVFGRYSPIGTLIGALLFGLMDAMQLRLQAIGFDISYYVFLMIPYIVTIIALISFGGKSFVPKAQGLFYKRDDR